MACLDTGIERQYGQIDRLTQLAVIDTRRNALGTRALALAWQHVEGIKGITAQLADPRAMQQLTVEIQVHAWSDAGLQRAHGAEQIAPGIAALGACRQHRAAENHRYGQTH